MRSGQYRAQTQDPGEGKELPILVLNSKYGVSGVSESVCVFNKIVNLSLIVVGKLVLTQSPCQPCEGSVILNNSKGR